MNQSTSTNPAIPKTGHLPEFVRRLGAGLAVVAGAAIVTATGGALIDARTSPGEDMPIPDGETNVVTSPPAAAAKFANGAGRAFLRNEAQVLGPSASELAATYEELLRRIDPTGQDIASVDALIAVGPAIGFVTEAMPAADLEAAYCAARQANQLQQATGAVSIFDPQHPLFDAARGVEGAAIRARIQRPDAAVSICEL